MPSLLSTFIVVNVIVNMYIIAGCRDSNGVMKRLIVGEVEITALTDIEGPFFRLSQLLPGVGADLWEPYVGRYPWAFADAGTLYGRVGAYVLRSPGSVVLVDTGIGRGAMGRRGRLIEDLERNGAYPDEVDSDLPGIMGFANRDRARGAVAWEGCGSGSYSGSW